MFLVLHLVDSKVILLSLMYSHSVTIRVLYGHVDKMDFVYYGHYLEYFEHARNELLRSLDLPYTQIEASGIKLPVKTAHVEYKSAARYDNLITVKAIIPEMPRAAIRIDYVISNEEGCDLVTGYTVHPFLNSRNRATRIPHSLRKVLQPHFEEKVVE